MAGNDQPHRRQALCRHRPRKECQPRPVRPRQTRMSARPPALGHSELMAQHQDLGVLPPPLPPRQPQQRYGTGDNQEDQLQPHKPKIIPRSRRRPAGQPTEHPARWHRFSAPTSTARPPARHCRTRCRSAAAGTCGMASARPRARKSPRTRPAGRRARPCRRASVPPPLPNAGARSTSCSAVTVTANATGSSGDLLAPEPTVLSGALIGYARVSTSGQLLDRPGASPGGGRLHPDLR